MGQQSGIAWLIFIVEAGALGAVASWFSVRTLRWFTSMTVLVLAIAIGHFGLLTRI